MTYLPSILDVDVRGKTVLVRADLNVPLVNGQIRDITRIERFAPTVAQLAERGAKVVIVSHLGRPKGVDHSLSLRVVAYALEDCLGRKVSFIEHCVGDIAERAVRALRYGEIALLENLRFHEAEEENSRFFAMLLNILGDIYVNDAFSCAHRAHASTFGICEFLPSYAGPSLLAEVSALTSVLQSPKRPVGALIGGAKVSSKIAILEQLVSRMDVLIIGGGMANTFLMAQGKQVGTSLYEPNHVLIASRIMAVAKDHGCKIILPQDVVVAKEFVSGARSAATLSDAVPEGEMILDVGPRTIDAIKTAIDSLSTLLWNGPLGAFECQPFDKATIEIAQFAADLTSEGRLITVAGGGDTAAALNASGVADRFTYLSTAGGAFLEWLEDKELPGISALMQSTVRMKEAN